MWGFAGADAGKPGGQGGAGFGADFCSFPPSSGGDFWCFGQSRKALPSLLKLHAKTPYFESRYEWPC
jgi:hypothetical protein